MRAIGKDEALHGYVLNVVPGDPCGQRDRFSAICTFTVFDEKGTNHRQVGIGSYAALVGPHGVFTTEATTHLTLTVGGHAVLEVVLHVLGEAGEHTEQVILHVVGCDRHDTANEERDNSK